MIVKNNNEEKSFIEELIRIIKSVNTGNISNIESLEIDVLNLTCLMERTWEKHSKIVNITKHSKSWWNDNCKYDLDIYMSTKHIEDWKQFRRIVKNAKHSFFNLKIQEITNKTKGPLELMNWVNKKNLSAIEAIKYNDRPYVGIEDL